MKQMKKDLQALSRKLNELTSKTEQMVNRLEQLEGTKVEKTPEAGVKAMNTTGVTKPSKITAIDTLFTIIKKSRKGVDVATLREKTGFDNKKVWNHINILKAKGKVRSVKRGVYARI